jgi:hypothetical protein
MLLLLPVWTDAQQNSLLIVIYLHLREYLNVFDFRCGRRLIYIMAEMALSE